MIHPLSNFCRKSPCIHGLAIAIALLSLSACTRGPSAQEQAEHLDAATEPHDETPDVDRFAPEPDARALRAAYPDLNGGDDCTQDKDCDAPLRCQAQECAFPPAMTGARDERTPTVTISREDTRVEYALELARTSAEQRRGLMQRRHMDPSFGMLFIYDAPAPQSFWMKNTYLPLDILFIDEDLRIESIVHSATPLSETPRASKGPAKYVLELRAGESKRHGFREGDAVTFAGLPDTP